MKTISRTFYSMPVNLVFFVAVPLFYFLFVLAYDPFDISEYLDLGKGRFTLNLIITSLTLLGVLALSRMLLFILRRIIDLNWTLYIIWCVGETVICGLLFSIPMGIGWIGQYTYFGIMSTCVLYLAGIVVFPYAICTLGVQAYVLSKRAAGAPAVDEKTLIRFQDDMKRIKLIVSSEAVLYIRAEENYVHIVHLDNGKVKDYALRSSMRALEDMLARHGLVRCHRSFFVNAQHVELVRKDAAGYALAQLDQKGLDAIPVSKRYYQALTALL